MSLLNDSSLTPSPPLVQRVAPSSRMRLSFLSAAIAALTITPVSADTQDAVDVLASKALATKRAYLAAEGSSNSSCNINNAAVRKEW